MTHLYTYSFINSLTIVINTSCKHENNLINEVVNKHHSNIYHKTLIYTRVLWHCPGFTTKESNSYRNSSHIFKTPIVGKLWIIQSGVPMFLKHSQPNKTHMINGHFKRISSWLSNTQIWGKISVDSGRLVTFNRTWPRAGRTIPPPWAGLETATGVVCELEMKQTQMGKTIQVS